MSLTVGRVTLDDPETLKREGTDLRLTGLDLAEGTTAVGSLLDTRENIAALEGYTVPLTWSVDSRLDGFYVVERANAELRAHLGESAAVAWALDLRRLGSESEVQFETRLVGADLSNDHTITGEVTHAPPIAAYGYSTGATLATTLTRETADGNITLYRGVPRDPVWSVAPADFYGGAVEVSRPSDSLVYQGREHELSPTDVQLSNGLVRIGPGEASSPDLELDVWDPEGNAWVSLASEGQVRVHADGMIAGWDGVTILRNDPEEAVLRFFQRDGTNGLVTLTVALRRGERFGRFYLTSDVSDTLQASMPGDTTSTVDQGGWISDDADDANGNRWVIGSAKSFTVASGTLSKATVIVFDVFAGAIIGGSTATAGDAGADLANQYIGGRAVKDLVVRR